MLTGLTIFFERLPGANKTVMPLKLSKAPLHTVLDNSCGTTTNGMHYVFRCIKTKKTSTPNLQINRPFSIKLRVNGGRFQR